MYFPDGAVDFDFGQFGQIDGFDSWRLWEFYQGRQLSCRFDSQQQVVDVLVSALANKELTAAPNGLLFVIDSVKILGAETARTLALGCALPHRNHDSVLTLSAQCFESASLMLDHYLTLDGLRQKEQRLSRSNWVKFRIYLNSWLGYLYATSEGFKNITMRLLLNNKRPAIFLELIAKCDEIGNLEKHHADDLRRLRNDVFHLRTDNETLTQFFSDGGRRMEWAKNLHSAFASLLSNYKILAEVHYLSSGRFGECEIRQESLERRRKQTKQKSGNRP